MIDFQNACVKHFGYCVLIITLKLKDLMTEYLTWQGHSPTTTEDKMVTDRTSAQYQTPVKVCWLMW